VSDFPKEVALDGLAGLYREFEGEWLLVEVVERDAAGAPRRLIVHAHDAGREKLHDWMAERDDWDWSRTYLLLHADPGKTCELSLSGTKPEAHGAKT
jgi:hypothetical protein